MQLDVARLLRDSNLHLIGTFDEVENATIQDIIVVPHRKYKTFLKRYVEKPMESNDDTLKRFPSSTYSVIRIYKQRKELLIKGRLANYLDISYANIVQAPPIRLANS